MNTWRVVYPNYEARKTLLRACRGKKNADNVYFISYIDGEIKGSVYKSSDAYILDPPKHTYQFEIKFNKFYSYKNLDHDIREAMDRAQDQIDFDMEIKMRWAKEILALSIDQLLDPLCPYQPKNESQALSWKQIANMIILSSYSDDALKYNFGYGKRIKELRLDALRIDI